MNEENHLSELDDLQHRLTEVQHLIERHRVVENLVHRQEMHRHDLVEGLVHKQHLNELQHKLETMHSADIAYILEALPLDERLLVWDLVKAERDGEILLEVSDAVKEPPSCRNNKCHCRRPLCPPVYRCRPSFQLADVIGIHHYKVADGVVAKGVAVRPVGKIVVYPMLKYFEVRRLILFLKRLGQFTGNYRLLKIARPP